VRLHLGHHFYGAGNLGDDFMLAGFLAALAGAAPDATCTSCVPFPLAPLRRRFPAVDWRAYDDATRDRGVAECDVWLGLGGSPFQHALSPWFVEHLAGEAARCAAARKPMFFLGVGLQGDETAAPAVRRIVAQAAGIWTRDADSAGRLARIAPVGRVAAGADLAHILFSDTPPPRAAPGRVTVVANFDYAAWPGQAAALAALDALGPAERVWLAQETRELPGAERALHAALPPAERTRWPLVAPEVPGAPLAGVLRGWPSGEWLLTSRFHAAIAGAWSGSRVVIIGTNEKLHAVARELGCPVVPPDAPQAVVTAACHAARPLAAPRAAAGQARMACAAFLRSAVAAAA